MVKGEYSSGLVYLREAAAVHADLAGLWVNLGALYAQFFLFTFAFSVFTSGFAQGAERRFENEENEVLDAWGAREVGILYGFSGLLGILWMGGLIGRRVKKFGEVRLTADHVEAALHATPKYELREHA